MKTKVTILGEAEAVKPELKKIEFVKCLDGNLDITKSAKQPSSYHNIELISKDYITGCDLMFAYDNGRRYGTLYIGHFNDGVV